MRCEFPLHCDGGVGCSPSAAEMEGTPPVAAGNWAHWHNAPVAPGVTPPWSHASIADFDDWLAAMVAEARPGYSDDPMHPLSRDAPVVGCELPPLEPGC